MIKLTEPAGSDIHVDELAVVRIRHSLKSEHPEANTHIVWPTLQLVRETTDTVVPMVRGRLVSLVELTSPNGSALWFDAKKSSGPRRLIPSLAPANAKSAILLAGKYQFFANTAAEVAAALKAAGVEPLPLPAQSPLSDFMASARTWISPPEVWPE